MKAQLILDSCRKKNDIFLFGKWILVFILFDLLIFVDYKILDAIHNLFSFPNLLDDVYDSWQINVKGIQLSSVFNFSDYYILDI